MTNTFPSLTSTKSPLRPKALTAEQLKEKRKNPAINIDLFTGLTKKILNDFYPKYCPNCPGKSPQFIVVPTRTQENSKILEYTNALLVGFSGFFICFFIFCFGPIFDSDSLFRIFKRSTLSLCFNPYQHLQTRKKGTIEMKLNGKRRTSNELSTFFTFLSYTFDTEYFHQAQKSEPLVDRLMTLCLSFQMEKAKKHSNYKRFILL